MHILKELQTYHDHAGYSTIKPVEAYTPRLEDAAEAIGELLVYMREQHGMTHEQAQKICSRWDVTENEYN